MINLLKDNDNSSNICKINDINIGEVKNYTIIYDIKTHESFGKYSGDFSKIHTDKQFAINNNFKDIIGYAFFLNSVFSQIYGMHFPGGTELCLKSTSNYKKSFFINDILKFSLTVIGKNESLQTLTLNNTIKNQEKQIIYDGESILKLSLVNK